MHITGAGACEGSVEPRWLGDRGGRMAILKIALMGHPAIARHRATAAHALTLRNVPGPFSPVYS